MKIILTCNNAGGGHKAAVAALTEIFQQQNRPWDVEVLDLDVALKWADPLFLVARRPSTIVYNWMLRNELTFWSRYAVHIMHFFMGLMSRVYIFILKVFFEKTRPDIVISVNSHYNRFLFQSLRAAERRVPLVTILTDFADRPPHFWFEHQPQDVICGTRLAAEQAREFVREERVWRVHGMVVHPRFYQEGAQQRSSALMALGLQADATTVVVCFGSHGNGRMLDIARHLASAGKRMQLIMLCGKNKKIAQKLRQLKSPIPIHIEGFTNEMASWLRLGDIFVGKPGPGAISEALAVGLPVIVLQNWKTLDHERYNARWVEEEGVGLSVRRIDEITTAIESILDPRKNDLLRRNIDANRPQAIFEVPEIIEKILARCRADDGVSSR